MNVQQLLLMTVVFSAVSTASAAEFTVKTNEWLHIPVAMPEKKVGGGDFYNLHLESLQSRSAVDYELEQNGVNVRSGTAGVYNFKIVVNHVTKSSCAGVEVDEYSSDELRVYVKD